MADQDPNADIKAKMREALDRKQGHAHPDDSADSREKAHGSEVATRTSPSRCTDARPVAAAPDRSRLTRRRTPLRRTGCPPARRPGPARTGPAPARGALRSRRAASPTPTAPVMHRADQRSGVVELVEAGDHRVHPGLPGRGVGIPAGERGGGGEAQWGDHRHPAAQHGEADHGHRPRRRRDDDRQRHERDPGTDAQQADGSHPLGEPVAGQAHQAAGHEVGQRGQRDEVLGGGEDVVEVDRSPGRGGRVDGVEDDEGQADQHDRPPRHVGLRRGRGHAVVAGQVGRERRQRAGARRRARWPTTAGRRWPGSAPLPITPPRVQAPWHDGSTTRPEPVLERDGLHVAGGVDDAQPDAVRREPDHEDADASGPAAPPAP